MDEIGQKGQEKLAEAKVFVLGAGGLASPVLTYLIMAGIGQITFVDLDIVSESNLNRQFLHSTEDIGRDKTQSAYEFLKSLNPQVRIKAVKAELNESNIEELVADSQIIITCVDNIFTRMLVNSFAMTKGLLLIDGGIDGFYGYVFATDKDHACLECMGIQNSKVKSPIESLGAVVGVIGSMMASICIKLILGISTDLGLLYQVDLMGMDMEGIEIGKFEKCSFHGECYEK